MTLELLLIFALIIGIQDRKKKKKMNAGGKVGRGYGKARGAKACKYVSMKGA